MAPDEFPFLTEAPALCTPAAPRGKPGSSSCWEHQHPKYRVFVANNNLGAGHAMCICARASQRHSGTPRTPFCRSGSFKMCTFIPGTSGNIFYVTVPSAGPSVCLPLTSHPLPLTSFDHAVQFQPYLAGSWDSWSWFFLQIWHLGSAEGP